MSDDNANKNKNADENFDAKADEAAIAHAPSPWENLPQVFWMTRDRHNGRLMNAVEVWLVRPNMYAFGDGDLMWVSPSEFVDKQDTHYATWSIAEAKINARTVPDTERECVCVGREGGAAETPLAN